MPSYRWTPTLARNMILQAIYDAIYRMALRHDPRARTCACVRAIWVDGSCVAVRECGAFCINIENLQSIEFEVINDCACVRAHARVRTRARVIRSASGGKGMGEKFLTRAGSRWARRCASGRRSCGETGRSWKGDKGRRVNGGREMAGEKEKGGEEERKCGEKVEGNDPRTRSGHFTARLKTPWGSTILSLSCEFTQCQTPACRRVLGRHPGHHAAKGGASWDPANEIQRHPESTSAQREQNSLLNRGITSRLRIIATKQPIPPRCKAAPHLRRHSSVTSSPPSPFSPASPLTPAPL